MNKPGYAVKKDGSFWRVVDGISPDPENPKMVCMDLETEEFMSFEDGPPPNPPPTHAELTLAAIHECDRLLAVAAIRIAPLQDAVDLESASADDIEMLKSWKKYRVELSRIQADQDFPSGIIWPVPPNQGIAS